MLKSSTSRFIFLGLLIALFGCLIMVGVMLTSDKPSPIRYAPQRPAPHYPGRVVAPPQAPPTIYPPPREERSPTPFDGIWSATGFMANRVCSLSLEMRGRPNGKVSGYATFICVTLLQRPVNIASLAALRTPHSAILTGGIEGESVIFTVDQMISWPPECPLTALQVRPFGASQLAAQWKNGTCPGGELVLARQTR